MTRSSPAKRKRPRLQQIVRSLPRPLRGQKFLVALWRLGIVRAPIQPLTFNGHARAWVDLRDCESRAVFLAGSFWPEFPPMVAAFLRNGGDLFDVGANFGLVTFGTLPLVQGIGATFHLFEANPRIIPVLQRSADEWPGERFRVCHCAVTDQPGMSHHYVPGASWGHGRISGGGDLVPNLVLDPYIVREKVDRVAFLKVDVEGWELRALLGAQQALASGRIAAGFVEVAPSALRRTGASAGELLSLLAGAGFDCYFAGMEDRPDLYGLNWSRVSINGTSLRFAVATPLPPSFEQGDVLMIHKSNPVASTVYAATRG